MPTKTDRPTPAEPDGSTERTLQVASAALRLIGNAASERELCEGVCRLLVEEAHYALAWIGEVRVTPERVVVPLVWSGDATYVRTARIRWDAESARGQGPTGRAIREGRAVALDALSEDPGYEPWLERARERGFGASCALPMRVDGTLSAVLNVYASRSDAFDEAEVARLEGLAEAVARGLERFRAHERLRAARDHLQAIHDASPDVIFLHGHDARMLDVNHRVEEFYGISREAFLRDPTVLGIGAPHTLEEAQGRVRQALEEGAVDFEWIARRGDDTPFPVEVRLRRLGPVPESPDEPAVVAIVRDLSERKRMQQQLLQAAKLESLSMLAAGVAHDFNNSLSAVLGALSLASRELPEHSAVREIVADATGAAQAARSLTRQLMAFGRGGDAEPEVFRLGPLVTRAARLALAGTSVLLRLDLEDDLPPVRGQRDQLAQVFHNLFLNAVQAMPDGGEVRVRARAVPGADAAPPAVRLEVEDTGPGIPTEALERVFDPFFTTKAAGTGLGLPTALAVVQRHGGRMDVQSAAGAGTTFTVELPGAAPTGEVSPRREPASRPGRSLRVLMLEDEPALRRVLTRLLEQLGHAVVAAPDGDAALEVARRERAAARPLDLALLDLTIRGGRGGAEILDELRELLPGVPLVGMSGYAKSESAEAPFDAFLPKPFTIEQFQRRIAALTAIAP